MQRTMSARMSKGISKFTLPSQEQAPVQLPVSDKKPVVKLMTVTPEIAIEWLDKHNTNNRNIREDHVRELARIIVTGQWEISQDAISFDTDGRLNNGQHRLWAIIVANKPVELFVIEGLTTTSYTVIDRGRNKQVHDIIGPTDGERNATVLASICRLLLMEERGNLHCSDKSALNPSVKEVQEFIQRNPLVRESAKFTTLKGIKLVMNGSIAGYLHFKCSARYPDQWNVFTDQLANGTGLTTGSPVLLLRNRLLANRSSRAAKLDRQYIMAITIKAWNAFIQNRKMGILSYGKDEAWPVVQ